MASAFSATRWVLFGTIGFRILAYGGQVIILRLLSREVFGVYSSLIDLLLMTLPALPFGLDALLIRHKAQRRRYVIALSHVLFALGVLFAILAGAGLCLPGFGESSFAARQFAGDVSSPQVLYAFALLMPILGVMATKLSIRSLLSADLDFKRISLGEFGNGMITWFGGAAAAALYPKAWALMAAYLCGELFECFWMYRGHAFRPLAVLAPRRWGILKKLFLRHKKFCLSNTADLTLNNFASAIPGPMILAMVSAGAAADFRVSRLLIQLPILLLAGSIWRVAYPALTSVTEEVLQDRVLKIIGTTAAFLAPGVIWLAIFAPVTAALIGGDKYMSAAPLVQWMSLYMLLTAVYSPISSLDMIRDRPEIGLYWNAVHTAVRIAIIWFFAPRGLLAVVAAMSVASAALWLVWISMLGWLLRAGTKRYVHAVARFVPSWIAIGLLFLLCDWISGPYALLGPILSVVPGLAYLYIHMKYFPREAEMIRKLAGRG